jgi:hypothetical protein
VFCVELFKKEDSSSSHLFLFRNCNYWPTRCKLLGFVAPIITLTNIGRTLMKSTKRSRLGFNKVVALGIGFTLGSVLLVMQSPAMAAGKCMIVGVDNGNGRGLLCFIGRPRYELSGSEGFRDAISQAIGLADGMRDNCPGAHVTVAPAKGKDAINCERGIPRPILEP